MKKIIFVIALNFMLITSAFSQKTFKICSKENQELCLIAQLPVNCRNIVADKSILQILSL